MTREWLIGRMWPAVGDIGRIWDPAATSPRFFIRKQASSTMYTVEHEPAGNSWIGKGAIPCVVARAQNCAQERSAPCRSLPKRSFLRDLQPLLGNTGWLYEATWVAFLYRRRQKSITSVHEVKRKFSKFRGGGPLMFVPG